MHISFPQIQEKRNDAQNGKGILWLKSQPAVKKNYFNILVVFFFFLTRKVLEEKISTQQRVDAAVRRFPGLGPWRHLGLLGVPMATSAWTIMEQPQLF